MEQNAQFFALKIGRLQCTTEVAVSAILHLITRRWAWISLTYNALASEVGFELGKASSMIDAAIIESTHRALCELSPTGVRGFEGLVAYCLEHHLNRTFRISSSGAQFGADAGSVDPGPPVYMEAKLYRKNTLKEEELLGKIAQLARRRPKDFATWILATTAPVRLQLAEALHDEVSGRKMHFVMLDWSEGNQIPLLFAFLSFNHKHVSAWLRQNDLERDARFAALRELDHYPLPSDDPSLERLRCELNGIAWDAAFVRRRLHAALATGDGTVSANLLQCCIEALELIEAARRPARLRSAKQLEGLRAVLTASAIVASSSQLMSDPRRVTLSGAALQDNLAEYAAVVDDIEDQEGRIFEGVRPVLSRIGAFFHEKLEAATILGGTVADISASDYDEVAADIVTARSLLQRALSLIDIDSTKAVLVPVYEASCDLMLHLNRRYIHVAEFAAASNRLDEALERAPSTTQDLLYEVLCKCRFVLGAFAKSGTLPTSTTFRFTRGGHDFLTVRGNVPGLQVCQHFAISRGPIRLALVQSVRDEASKSLEDLVTVSTASDLVRVLEICLRLRAASGTDVGLPSSDHLRILYEKFDQAAEIDQLCAPIASDVLLDGLIHSVRLYCVPWFEPHVEGNPFEVDREGNPLQLS